MFRGMKKIVLALFLMFAASFVHADTINLMSLSPYSYSDVYTFPANSAYAPFYGTGIGLVEAGVCCNSGWTQSEAYGGTTLGHVTHFAYAYFYSSPWGNVNMFNSTFNSKTDVFQSYFLAGGKQWHLSETFSAPYGSWGYNDGTYIYSYTYGNLTKASATTVPEPGTLGLLGTGLLSITGVVRKKLKLGAVS
jgi:hypothetical protein